MKTRIKTRYIGVIGLALAITAILFTLYYFGSTCNAVDIFLLNSLIILEVAGIAAVFSLFILMRSRQEKYARKAKKALKRR